MQVKYSVEEVPGRGKGLIAQEDIKEGTLIFDMDLAKKEVFTTEESFRNYLNGFDRERQQEILIHAGVYEGVVHVLDDPTKYTNHSENPNLIPKPYGAKNFYAAWNIKKGEELVENYCFHTYLEWFEKITQELDSFWWPESFLKSKMEKQPEQIHS